LATECVVGAVKEAHRTEHVITFAHERLTVRKAGTKKSMSRFFKVIACGRISHLWRTQDRCSGFVASRIIGHLAFLGSSMLL
jgi:hypothetical protein